MRRFARERVRAGQHVEQELAWRPTAAEMVPASRGPSLRAGSDAVAQRVVS